jgi:hypothetical protein
MRNKFSEFSYKPNLEKLWQECDFVFDANVLLDLYYDRKVYTNFINILENKIPDRIWMPYQVGLEYHINRVDGVQKISNDYYNFINGIQSLKGVKTIYNKLNETHCINLGKIYGFRRNFKKFNIYRGMFQGFKYKNRGKS